MKNILHFANMAFIVAIITLSSCTSTTEQEQKTSNSKYFPEGISTLYFDGQPHYIRTDGTYIASFPTYNKVDNQYNPLAYFSEGLTVASTRQKKGGRFVFDRYYVDMSGNKVIDEVFGYATLFENGYAITTLKKEGKKWCLINKKGEHIIEADGMRQPYNDVVWIQNEDELWGLAKIQGTSHTMIRPFEYRITGAFVDGICWVEKESEDDNEEELDTEYDRAFMNTEGKIISSWYANAGDFRDGVATVKDKVNGAYGVIDKSGKVIIEPKYSYISGFSEGLSAFYDKDEDTAEKWGYLDKNGNEVIKRQFDFATEFNEGYAEVRNGADKVGFINTKGELIVDYAFEQVYPFYEGYAAVRKTDKWGFIDTSGKVVIDYQYDQIVSFPKDALNAGFSGGMVKVEKNGNEFFINTKGECILGCKDK